MFIKIWNINILSKSVKCMKNLYYIDWEWLISSYVKSIKSNSVHHNSDSVLGLKTYLKIKSNIS